MTQPRFIDGSVRLIGDRWSPKLHELKDFLARSRVPYRWADVEKKDGSNGRESGAQSITVKFPDGSALEDPDIRAVAEKLGLDTEPEARHYDVVIVGGGPAGLSAAINCASEGLRVVVVEQGAAGGQASYSAFIENYPGFPEGLSGGELSKRTVDQAERFGAEVLVTRRATGLSMSGDSRIVTIDDGTQLAAHTVLITVGVSFRWLEAPGCPSLVGAGIYYGAATSEASACRDQDIYILGGGNSAGQAALLLARYARRVIIVAPDESLEESMSQYLIERIDEMKNITVRSHFTVTGAEGKEHLERLTLEDVHTGATERVPASSLFIFIGATPQTDWLGPELARDEHGFVLSGYDYMEDCERPAEWPLERSPYGLETSVPGVFVAGDVRKGSVKRLTAAAGEGAMAASMIYEYCQQFAGIAWPLRR
jgi:thioredoxin reductase (NADPH)